MSAGPEPIVLAVGIVDELGIAGSAGIVRNWRELGVEPPGTAATLRELFGTADPTYRRIDRLSRALVLASEAAGVRGLLAPEQRAEAALVVETCHGCLEADLRYARSLGDPMVDAAAFPYTLPSTCLGEVALRLGIRGPTVCLSVAPPGGGESLDEARLLLAGGEVRHVLAGTADVAPAGPAGPAVVRVVLALLARPGDGAAIADWQGTGAGAFAALAAACR